MPSFGETLSFGNWCFLLLALGLALSFEFVNGFHDTANAVATVIYTHSLKPTIAVVWSGCWNLIGVLLSSGAIAYGIVALLPVDLVINAGSAPGFAMVFALLISAIIWNIGTWWLGLPASSSHTLIGAILGVGLGNSLFTPGMRFGDGVNWEKAGEVGVSLLMSPVIGFCCAALLLLGAKVLIRIPALYAAPHGKNPPPLWIRCILILTCTGVSFAHGSNDGQKGMGLIMLILIGILPARYALNPGADAADIAGLVASSQAVSGMAGCKAPPRALNEVEAEAALSSYLKTSALTSQTWVALSTVNQRIARSLDGKSDIAGLSGPERKALRGDMYLASSVLAKLEEDKTSFLDGDRVTVTQHRERLERFAKYIPGWVKLAVACALGFGTMIGWKRIVVTVGEKIGKDHLTYAQGAAAELVAMITIGASDYLGLPVSTTHVLSSGIAGTMAANRSGLQTGTLRNLLLAWVLTLPVCVLLGAATFAAGLFIVLKAAGQ